jgi:hypothetical protein
MSIAQDIMRWSKLVDGLEEEQLSEVAKTPQEKLDLELTKTDSKIMQEKLKKLNMLVKQKYMAKDAELPEEKMFQFRFEDRGSHYEFSMPLRILLGPATRDFCAKYWDDFFAAADIRTTFKDNIDEALKQTGGISLTMKLNKGLTKEVE